jgi:MFS family permease
MVATAIPQITKHFSSLEDIGWYASAYLLAVALCQTSCKMLYKFFSIKWMYVLYVFIFGVGTLICGTARSSTVLIIGRAVAGAGSTGISPVFPAIITYCIPPGERTLHYGYLGVIHAIASISGPIIGGALASDVSWRWCFYINSLAACVAIILIVCFLKLPIQAAATTDWKDLARKIDILGLAILMPAIVCLLLALQWGGTRYPWADSKIVALLTLFGVLLYCFVVIQWKKGEHATIPSAILRERSALAIVGFAFGLGSSISLITYYLPIWFQVVKGVSALKSGIMNLPLLLTVSITSTFSTYFLSFSCLDIDMNSGTIAVSRIGYHAPLMLGSSILTATGIGMLYTLTPRSSFAEWVGYQAIAGIGIGLGISIPITAAKMVSDIDLASTTISVCLFMQAIGGAVFVSVGQSIFINKFVADLEVHSADLLAVLSSGLTDFRNATGSPDDVKLIYNSSLTCSFVAGAAVAAASVIGSLVYGWESLRLLRLARQTNELHSWYFDLLD